jgi:hypothetical protein
MSSDPTKLRQVISRAAIDRDFREALAEDPERTLRITHQELAPAEIAIIKMLQLDEWNNLPLGELDNRIASFVPAKREESQAVSVEGPRAHARTTNTRIAVINMSTVLEDRDIRHSMKAIEHQIHHDFAPVWGIDANISFAADDSGAPSGSWWLLILDDADQADVLGYHDLTDEGLPLGKVFARTDQQHGACWTVTASHEVLEMLMDPDINLCAFVQTNNNNAMWYAYEVCDPCELDDQGYSIDGVQVSDFVYPAWFQGFQETGATFDRNERIYQPFQLLPGGYASVFEVPSGLGWYQINGPPAPASSKGRSLSPPVGSRRERRRRARSQWLRSARK